jgi:hypothetical protein
MLRLALLTPGPESLDTFSPFIRMCPTRLTNPFLAISDDLQIDLRFNLLQSTHRS